MKTVIEITNQNEFDEQLKQDKPMLVDFWAEWCGPCRMITPIINEIGEEYKEKMIVSKVNVDDNPEIAAAFGVRSIPTLLVLKNGEIMKRQAGAIPKNKIVELFQNYIV